MAVLLDIIRAPHPILSRVMPPFDWQRPIRDPRELARDLCLTMRALGGCGLAAPQVGIETRCFVMELGTIEPGTKERNWIALFNPVITEASDEMQHAEEGCLSLPGEHHRVMRPRRITLIWENEEGQTSGAHFENFSAHQVAHELDHLDGRTLHDIIAPAARARALSPAGRALAMRRQHFGRRVG